MYFVVFNFQVKRRSQFKNSAYLSHWQVAFSTISKNTECSCLLIDTANIDDLSSLSLHKSQGRNINKSILMLWDRKTPILYTHGKLLKHENWLIY